MGVTKKGMMILTVILGLSGAAYAMGAGGGEGGGKERSSAAD